jgi:anti-sigma B factor antagonist
MGLAILTRSVNRWTVVHVTGDVDLQTASTLRSHLVEIITSGRRRLVLDLERVDLLDSTGIAVLVGVQHRLRAAGGQLRLVSAGEAVRKPLRVTGLLGAFDIYPALDAALTEEPASTPSRPDGPS